MFPRAIDCGRDFLRPVGSHSRTIRFLKKGEERLYDVDRHRENNSRVLLCADFGQGLEVAQLHRCGNAAENLGGVDERLGGLELGLGVNDLGAPIALGLSLFGDRSHHVFGEFDGSDLDVADLDPPSFRL